MVKIILVGIIVALVYSQPNLRLTIADWLNNVSDFLTESVEKKQEDYEKLRFKTNESMKNNYLPLFEILSVLKKPYKQNKVPKKFTVYITK